jgi:hypothetical protein
MITIQCSSELLAEKKYIFEIIFTEFLGIEYSILHNDESNDISIELKNGKLIIFNSLFLNGSDESYLNFSNLPTVVITENIFTPENNIPVLFGQGNIIDVSKEQIKCGIDIFSTCFFMLSRMEEAIIQDRDSNDRFAAKSSVAYQYGILDRPIVDEYVEMLWNMMKHLDGNIERKAYKPSNFITCDVDWPFDVTKNSFYLTCRKSMGDLIHRKSLKQCFNTLKNYTLEVLNFNDKDYLTENLRWMMDVNEEAGNKVSFYFITEYTSKNDIKVNFDSDKMRKLFNEINNRGHEIGLHPGYNCFDSDQNFKKSAETLRRVLKEENLSQRIIGGRMHFLRWDILKTPQLWDKYNFNYDTTLSYADAAGFRCGTCHEFSMFDLKSRKKMSLKQRPLITMESTIIGPKYENLGYTENALNRFKYFKNICHKYNGEYVLLWHNSSFENEKNKEFYKEIIQ